MYGCNPRRLLRPSRLLASPRARRPPGSLNRAAVCVPGQASSLPSLAFPSCSPLSKLRHLVSRSSAPPSLAEPAATPPSSLSPIPLYPDLISSSGRFYLTANPSDPKRLSSILISSSLSYKGGRRSERERAGIREEKR